PDRRVDHPGVPAARARGSCRRARAGAGGGRGRAGVGALPARLPVAALGRLPAGPPARVRLPAAAPLVRRGPARGRARPVALSPGPPGRRTPRPLQVRPDRVPGAPGPPVTGDLPGAPTALARRACSARRHRAVAPGVPYAALAAI